MSPLHVTEQVMVHFLVVNRVKTLILNLKSKSKVKSRMHTIFSPKKGLVHRYGTLKAQQELGRACGGFMTLAVKTPTLNG